MSKLFSNFGYWCTYINFKIKTIVLDVHDINFIMPWKCYLFQCRVSSLVSSQGRQACWPQAWQHPGSEQADSNQAAPWPEAWGLKGLSGYNYSCGRQSTIYPTYSILWLLIPWGHKQLRHQQPWYWPICTRILRLQHRYCTRREGHVTSYTYWQKFPCLSTFSLFVCSLSYAALYQSTLIVTAYCWLMSNTLEVKMCEVPDTHLNIKMIFSGMRFPL